MSLLSACVPCITSPLFEGPYKLGDPEEFPPSARGAPCLPTGGAPTNTADWGRRSVQLCCDVTVVNAISSAGHRLQRWSQADGEDGADVHHPEADGLWENQGWSSSRKQTQYTHSFWEVFLTQRPRPLDLGLFSYGCLPSTLPQPIRAPLLSPVSLWDS